MVATRAGTEVNREQRRNWTSCPEGEVAWVRERERERERGGEGRIRRVKIKEKKKKTNVDGKKETATCQG